MWVINPTMAGCIAPRVDPELKAKAKALFLAGATSLQISSECGLNAGSIRAWATRGKWVEQKNAVAKQIRQRISDKVDAVANAAMSEHTKLVSSVTAGQIDRLAKLNVKKTHSITEIANALKTFDDVARRNLGLVDQQPGSTAFSLSIGEVSVPTKSAQEPKTVVDV